MAMFRSQTQSLSFLKCSVLVRFGQSQIFLSEPKGASRGKAGLRKKMRVPSLREFSEFCRGGGFPLGKKNFAAHVGGWFLFWGPTQPFPI